MKKKEKLKKVLQINFGKFLADNIIPKTEYGSTNRPHNTVSTSGSHAGQVDWSMKTWKKQDENFSDWGVVWSDPYNQVGYYV